MGICAANGKESNLYEKIYASSQHEMPNYDKSEQKQMETSSIKSLSSHNTRFHFKTRKKTRNYRSVIIKAYIHHIEKLLNIEINKNEIKIPKSIIDTILSYFPYVFNVYGIGKFLTSNEELTEFERINVFEPKLFNLNNIIRGKSKYLLSASYNSEIYGIGLNWFDGLYLNREPHHKRNGNDYSLHRIDSFYKYFDFMDTERAGNKIEILSDTVFSNDIVIKLQNGSIYKSKLILSNKGRWKRTFHKINFSQNVHVIIGNNVQFKAISCGLLHTLLLSTNGNLFSFGDNNLGQCGLGYTSEIEEKINLISINKKIKSINCGEHHSACLDTNSNLWCFGYNNVGQCGKINNENNDHIIISRPMNVYRSSKRIVKAECGESFTVYLDDDENYYGFGKIIVSTLDRVNITKWDYYDHNNNRINLKFWELSCGYNHVMLIGIDNNIYAHGSNEYSKCGLKIGRASKPTKVKNNLLPNDLLPVKVIAGTNNSIIIYNFVQQ